MAITDEILERSALPQSMTAEGHTVNHYSLAELIAAAKYLEDKAAMDVAVTQPHFGLRFTKFIPPGGG